MEDLKLLDEKELKEVFQTFRHPLYAFILSRTGNTHDAEDLCSKSFVKFFRYAKTKGVRKITLKAFLFQIAANTVRDFFRKQKIVRFISLSSIPKTEEKGLSIDTRAKEKLSLHPMDAKDSIQAIEQIVSKLPAVQKEAFYLRYVEDFSFKEIARIQNTALATALSRVRYAVLKIRKTLGEHYEEIRS